MNRSLKTFRSSLRMTFLVLAMALALLSSSPAFAKHPLLEKIIADQNLRDLEESLVDGSYRGEAGILRIGPEVGKSLGITVFMDQDYIDAMKLFEMADKSLEAAEEAMASEEKETFPGEHVQNIANYCLRYKNAFESAKQKVAAYRSRLNSSNDERLNQTMSNRLLDPLLTGSLSITGDNLREALGHFYNACRGTNQKGPQLRPENVTFVNKVFHRFITQNSEETLKAFNLDRQDDYRRNEVGSNWKAAVTKKDFRYIAILEAVLRKLKNKTNTVDPLLFIALMRQESNFDPLAVSSVGAAGLTQIMPQTAIDLGMKNIFKPTYLSEAARMLHRERKAKRGALDALHQINEKNSLKNSKRARTLMQDALVFGRKKERLYARYKKELLRKRSDDRLKPSLAVEYGFTYFAQLMKAQKGDISLALASYNAGPHRVRKLKGIPPFEETVRFRNQVLLFYREYLKRAKAGL